MSKLHILSLSLLTLICSPSKEVFGQSPESDWVASSVIFGHESLHNTLELYEQLGSLSVNTQYERLRDHVFPPGTHVIRMDCMAAPHSWSRPVPLATVFPTFNRDYLTLVDTSLDPAMLLVPVVSLIEVAAKVGRQREFESLLNEQTGHRANSNVDALLIRTLLAISNDQKDKASEHMLALGDMLKKVQPSQNTIGGVIALIWKASPIDELRDESLILASQCYDLARADQSPLDELWKRYAFATHYRLQALHESSEANVFRRVGKTKSHWHPVTRSSSLAMGKGYPVATWQITPGQATKAASSDRDFLYFDLPLSGDFSIEALVSAFNYRETQLGYGGLWSGPHFNHESLLCGTFSRDSPPFALSPPLDPVTDAMRVRLEVSQGVSRTFIDGREVFQVAVSAADPWLVIHSDWSAHGWVKDLRIMGAPSIPEAIDLLADDRLLGFDDFYQTSNGDQTNWEAVPSSTDPAISNAVALLLRSKKQDVVSDSHFEQLLRYHRPIFEDASISYEFYYRQGSHAVHPAIGNQAYLLNAGVPVSVHTITNGVDECTRRRPDAVSAINKTSIDPYLRDDDWNRVDIRVEGDHYYLSLNGVAVYDAMLANDTPRIFGLFHFCDQTEALVRDIRWTGGWPKTLDIIESQDLKDPHLEEQLAGPPLEQKFSYDFANGVSLESFEISGEGWKENLTQVEKGVRLVRPGGNYVQYTIMPHLKLDGDFDVIAEFEDFGSTIESGGDGNIHLMLGFEENIADYRLYRKFSRFEKKELGQQMIQAAYFHTREGHRSYEFPKIMSEAAAGGKLRFVRRGNQLHFLFAANDSEYFRLLHSERVTTAATRVGGLSLGIETTKPGEASVVWKSIEVRAQRLEGAALESSLSVSQLNQSRDKLMQTVKLDFTDAKVAKRLRTWGTDATFQYEKDGLLVTAPGFNEWQGHGLSPQLSLQGDFDIDLELEVRHIEAPQAGGECVVFLDIRFQDPAVAAIQAKFAMSPDGMKNGELTKLSTADTGEQQYKELVHYPLESVHALRIACRDRTVYVLVQETPTSNAIVLGRVKLSDGPISANYLSANLHTAGVGRKTIALFKRMTICADVIQEPMLVNP